MAIGSTLSDENAGFETTAQSLLLRAASYATRMHGDQQRKYTGEPYVVHCFEVAQIVTKAGGSPEMAAAAILHDVVEDTVATIEDVEAEFGPDVAALVGWLTDVSKPEDGNRAFRKAMDREHLASAPPEAKTIKLADLISNTRSIVEHGKGFARVYLKEKLLLLDVLGEGDPELLALARTLANEGMARLGEAV